MLAQGDETARPSLLEATQQRLRTLAQQMLRGDRLHRWEETDDLLQEASLALYHHLEHVRPADPREFFSLAAFHLRRALIKMARHYCGPHGMAANHDSAGRLQLHELAGDSSTPSQVATRSEQWLRLAHALELLSPEEREVTEMIWFHGLSQGEVARLVSINERTVRRRWQRARLKLFDALAENDRSVMPV